MQVSSWTRQEPKASEWCQFPSLPSLPEDASPSLSHLWNVITIPVSLTRYRNEVKGYIENIYSTGTHIQTDPETLAISLGAWIILSTNNFIPAHCYSLKCEILLFHTELYTSCCLHCDPLLHMNKKTLKNVHFATKPVRKHSPSLCWRAPRTARWICLGLVLRGYWLPTTGTCADRQPGGRALPRRDGTRSSGRRQAVLCCWHPPCAGQATARVRDPWPLLASPTRPSRARLCPGHCTASYSWCTWGGKKTQQIKSVNYTAC